MVIAALISFAALLVAWLIAPAERRARHTAEAPIRQRPEPLAEAA